MSLSKLSWSKTSHESPTVIDGDVPEGDVGAINKSDTSTECSVHS